MHTGPIPAIVSAEITLNLVVGAEYGVPVAAQFSYGAHEPLSVTAAFHAADNEVRWVFARDLLDEGTRHPAGEGDVTCWPATISGRRVVCIALRSPSGQALLEAPADDIRRRKKSLPVLLLRERLGADEREYLDALYATESIAPAGVADVLRLMARENIQAEVAAEVARYHDEAARALAGTKTPDNPYRLQLDALIARLATRTG